MNPIPMLVSQIRLLHNAMNEYGSLDVEYSLPIMCISDRLFYVLDQDQRFLDIFSIDRCELLKRHELSTLPPGVTTLGIGASPNGNIAITLSDDSVLRTFGC